MLLLSSALYQYNTHVRKEPGACAGLSLISRRANYFCWPAGLSVFGFASPWFCCGAGCAVAGSTFVVPGATGFWFSLLT